MENNLKGDQSWGVPSRATGFVSQIVITNIESGGGGKRQGLFRYMGGYFKRDFNTVPSLKTVDCSTLQVYK